VTARRRRSRTIGAGVAALVVLVGLGAILAVVTGTGSSASAAPHYVDETATAGIVHAFEGVDDIVGGGVAVFDCDDDGRPDLFLAGGTAPAALYRNESTVGGPLRFAEAPTPDDDRTAVTGAYPIDIDGDGRTDLAVLRRGENVLLRGLGDCHFERANEAWGFDGGQDWTTAFSATWEGEAALPTLAFGNYVDESSDQAPVRCADDVLIRADAAGTGYAAPIPLTPSWCTLSMLFSDWDRSGRRDLRVSNDRHYYGEASDGQEQLWRIAPGVSPRQYTAAAGWATVKVWGMGIATYDLTDDGYPEYFLTSQADNKLQTLAGDPARPAYRDIALERGVTATHPFVGDTSLPSTAWHAEFQDVDNDGRIDLYVAKGNVAAMPDFAAKDPSNLLLGQPDGTFREGAEGAGIVHFGLGRGAALADLNLDGMLDLVEVDRLENVRIWRNAGSGDAQTPRAMGGWLALRLEQPGANRDGIGSWIEVKVGDRIQRRELTIGGGHGGGQLGWTHIGLGDADAAQVRVQWPDGETGPWLPVAANGFAIIERGADEARPWLPPT
jgi:enediyne biosynthesis protein E4